MTGQLGTFQDIGFQIERNETYSEEIKRLRRKGSITLQPAILRRADLLLDKNSGARTPAV